MRRLILLMGMGALVLFDECGEAETEDGRLESGWGWMNGVGGVWSGMR